MIATWEGTQQTSINQVCTRRTTEKAITKKKATTKENARATKEVRKTKKSGATKKRHRRGESQNDQYNVRRPEATIEAKTILPDFANTKMPERTESFDEAFEQKKPNETESQYEARIEAEEERLEKEFGWHKVALEEGIKRGVNPDRAREKAGHYPGAGEAGDKGLEDPGYKEMIARMQEN